MYCFVVADAGGKPGQRAGARPPAQTGEPKEAVHLLAVENEVHGEENVRVNHSQHKDPEEGDRGAHSPE